MAANDASQMQDHDNCEDSDDDARVYNALGAPVAAGILYPLTSTLISPIWANAAMTFSLVSVIANALRLRRLQL